MSFSFWSNFSRYHCWIFEFLILLDSPWLDNQIMVFLPIFFFVDSDPFFILLMLIVDQWKMKPKIFFNEHFLSIIWFLILFREVQTNEQKVKLFYLHISTCFNWNSETEWTFLILTKLQKRERFYPTKLYLIVREVDVCLKFALHFPFLVLEARC